MFIVEIQAEKFLFTILIRFSAQETVALHRINSFNRFVQRMIF